MDLPVLIPSDSVSEPVDTSVADTAPKTEELQPVSGPELTNVAPKRKIDDVSEIVPSDGPSSKVPKTFVKDESHWFFDGNVLFQIGDTRFKLYRGRLMRESPWFRALIEQHSNGVPSEPYCAQKDIDKALRSTERVGELDIFYLDFANGPTPEQFGTLLSVIEDGIDHVHEPPGFDTMVQIFEAASFFSMKRYIDYTRRYLEDLFPDSVQSITDAPSPHAARALLLGIEYGVPGIVPHCFYDLVRTHPLYLPQYNNPRIGGYNINSDDEEDSDDDSDYKNSEASDDESDQDDDDDNDDDDDDDDDDDETESDASESEDDWTPPSVALKNASPTTFFRLFNIQRETVLSWDRIRDHLKYKCAGHDGNCDVSHRASSTYQEMKQRHPFDPIMGIRGLLLEDSDVKKYCRSAKRIVEKKLKSECDTFWSRIQDHALA